MPAYTREQIVDAVCEIVTIQTDVEAGLDSRIIEDLGADSLDGVEIEMELEEKFGLEFNEEDEAALRKEGLTVKDIGDRIERKLSAK